MTKLITTEMLDEAAKYIEGGEVISRETVIILLNRLGDLMEANASLSEKDILTDLIKFMVDRGATGSSINVVRRWAHAFSVRSR